ncbi:MAG TPA: hypothetical protein VLI92_03385, partial [Candidatus Saccharimonadales bacterium]|nr:hypothetical protein [Candidatus Saccharimonadales bacterium]
MFRTKSIKLSYYNLNLGLYLLLLFFTPLIFVSNTSELYEFPKTFFIYFFGSTIIFLFLLHQILSPAKLKSPNLLVLAWLVSYLLSTIFSSHLYTSVWGYFTRFNGGLVSVLVFFGIYFVALNSFSRQDLKRLFCFAIFTLIPVGVYAISQHYDFAASSPDNLRVYSTFGQPDW